MVFVVGETVMLLPVPAGVPPHEAEYHLAVAPVPALPPETVSVVLLPLQMVEIPEIPVGAVERLLTIMIISVETGAVEAQVAFEIISTFITSLWAKLLRVSVAPVSPFKILLFKNHL